MSYLVSPSLVQPCLAKGTGCVQTEAFGGRSRSRAAPLPLCGMLLLRAPLGSAGSCCPPCRTRSLCRGAAARPGVVRPQTGRSRGHGRSAGCHQRCEPSAASGLARPRPRHAVLGASRGTRGGFWQSIWGVRRGQRRGRAQRSLLPSQLASLSVQVMVEALGILT